MPRPSEMNAKSPPLRRLDEIDEAVFERIAGWESPAMDRLMPALSQAASHSKIWIALAAAMSLAGGKKGRRAAVEGLAAVAITSFLANLVAKSLFRRRRPTDQVPEGATSPDAGFILDALRPHRICRRVHSRRGRGISQYADPTQRPRRHDRILPGLHRSAPPQRCHSRLAPRERDRNTHTCDREVDGGVGGAGLRIAGPQRAGCRGAGQIVNNSQVAEVLGQNTCSDRGHESTFIVGVEVSIGARCQIVMATFLVLARFRGASWQPALRPAGRRARWVPCRP